SGASHGNKGHSSPAPAAPKNNSNNGHAGKITICHATRSVTNPYVEITISVNGLHGHGPADDSRHHAGSWKDIIPAPAEGCPGTTQQQSVAPKHEQGNPAKPDNNNGNGNAGKITICHATRSFTNPYVEITIS